MVFVPKYETRFIEPLCTNIRDYLMENEAAALAWANMGERMEATKVWRLSRWFNTLFPVTSIIPIRTTPACSHDGSRIDETHRITLEVEIDGKDPDQLVSACCRRITAYDALLRQIEKQHLFAGLNPATTGGEWMELGDHEYSYFAQSTSLYKVTGSFSIMIQMIEGRHKDD